MSEPGPGAQGDPPRESVGEVIKRLGPAAWAAVYTLTVPLVGGLLLYLYNAPIIEFWKGLGPAAPIVYALVFAIPLGTAILPTQVQAVLAGFLFAGAQGVGAAVGAAMGAIVIGAAIGYALARLVAGDRARRVVREHPRWEIVEEALLESGFWRTTGVVALVRLPSTPFALTNLALAAMRTDIWAYLVGTAVGALPRTVLWVFVGRGLHSFSKEAVAEAGVPWWGVAVSIAGILGALAVMGHIARKAMARAALSPKGEVSAPRAEGATPSTAFTNPPSRD